MGSFLCLFNLDVEASQHSKGRLPFVSSEACGFLVSIWSSRREFTEHFLQTLLAGLGQWIAVDWTKDFADTFSGLVSVCFTLSVLFGLFIRFFDVWGQNVDLESRECSFSIELKHLFICLLRLFNRPRNLCYGHRLVSKVDVMLLVSLSLIFCLGENFCNQMQKLILVFLECRWFGRGSPAVSELILSGRQILCYLEEDVVRQHL